MPKSFHEKFISQIQDLLGEEESCQLLASLNDDAVVSVRMNKHKLCSLDFFDNNTDIVKWCKSGRYLEHRPNFTLMPQLHCGCFYVQDASSMIYEEIVSRLISDKNAPINYLDMCAAPGGKTTAAINVLPQKSLVVANEFVAQRANILKENLQKWGSPDMIVTNSSAEKLGCLSGLFDIVAVDAPCSGEGMMRKDEEAVRQWTPNLVGQCTSLQWDIVSNIWNALKSGGYLIYSTCTFNHFENELMIERICTELEGETIDMNFPNEWGVISGKQTKQHCYRFMPHKTRGEGLFVSVIRKKGQQDSLRTKSKNSNFSLKKFQTDWIKENNEFSYFQISEMICGLRTTHLPAYTAISSVAKVILSGLEIAIEKRKDLIPQHALSQSWILNKEAFPAVELDYQTAIAYLRRENISLPENTPKGYVVVNYDGNTLGFVKHLGNRSNNLYPQEWRIRNANLK